MKIAVWRTGHDIANCVGHALTKGVPNAILWHTQEDDYLRHVNEYDAHIAYGILRGTAEIFRECNIVNKPWFNVDRGYFKPGHYNGYYRISYKGTQATSNWVKPDYDRLDALKLDIKPWRGFDSSKPVLVCPPTKHVYQFFGLDGWGLNLPANCIQRTKGDPNPINFNDYSYVLTFNSSIGWQALQAGIPCVSDPTYSMVGSWYNKIELEDLSEKQYATRNELFATMAASQFTLQEIEQGKAWEYLSHFTYSSATMAGKQSPQMSQPTQSAEGLKARFQSNT